MASAPVPVCTSLDQIFPDKDVLLKQGSVHSQHAVKGLRALMYDWDSVRYNNLAEEFENHFGKKPAYIVRAPGRVK